LHPAAAEPCSFFLLSQDAELMAAGCAKVFKEKVSGAKTDRPELAKVIGGLNRATCWW